MISKNRFLPPAFFALLATVLIISWFRYGHLYGGGDVGIPSYDPQRILDIARFVWWDVSAPGTTVPHGLTSVPFQFIQANLANFGLSYVAIQALFFWIILFLMGYGMFLLSLTVFGKDKIGLALLSGLFYELNPYMMIEIWHRFIHTTFFLAAALPFIFIFWTKWIKNGKFTFLFLFLLVSFLSTHLFGTLGFAFTIIFLLIFIFLVEGFIPWQGISHFRTVNARFVVGALFWLTIHLWWLLPVLNITPVTVSAQHTIGGSLATLREISKQSIIPHILAGINPYYLYEVADWGEIYDWAIFRMTPFLVLVFLIPGFAISLQSKKLVGWSLLFLSAIMLSKGMAEPFGNLFSLAFSKFFVLGTIRNPFEKLGILIPFASSILFSMGISFYLRHFGGKSQWFVKPMITIVLILFLGFFAWPMWGGKLFGKYDKLAFVEIPPSYIEADNFLKSEGKDGNILHLPLTVGESATYYWQYGYNGVESSQLYFTALPSISRGFNIDHIDDALLALSNIFSSTSVDDEKIITLLKSFNVRFIILHKDMEWRGGSLRDPAELELVLNRANFLLREAQFDQLVIYQVKDEYFAPRIELTNQVQYLDSGKGGLWPHLLRQNQGAFITPQDSKKLILSKADEKIILPQQSYLYDFLDTPLEQAVGELPSPSSKFFPDSPLYFFTRLKEKIDVLTASYDQKFLVKLAHAGKRLVEAYNLKQKSISVLGTIKIYQNQMNDLFKDKFFRNELGSSLDRQTLGKIFSKHLAILKSLESSAHGVELELLDNLRTYNFIPKVSKDQEQAQVNIANFEIPETGPYQLLLVSQDSENFYPQNLKKMRFYINGQPVDLSGEKFGQFLSFGDIALDGGPVEISYPVLDSNNLIEVKDETQELELTSDKHQPTQYEVEITPVSPNTEYRFEFESWIKKGDWFKVELIQDTDRSFPGQEWTIVKDNYNNFFSNNTVSFTLHSQTTQAKIKLLVEPWDDCKKFYGIEKKCQTKKSREPFERESQVTFKNLKLIRRLNNPVFLKSHPVKKDIESGGSITFRQVSSVLFQGELKLARPSFLIFKESFHPDWQLKLEGDQGSFYPQERFSANSFANAWYIEETGDYRFSLEFVGQRWVDFGRGLSIFGAASVVFLAIWQKRRG